MGITLHKPFSISETEVGIRNTDVLYPNHNTVSKRDRLFITCDGRNEKSQTAGKLLCEAIYLYFNSFLEDKENISYDFFVKAIHMGEIAISNYATSLPQEKGIYTTLSLFFLASDHIYICQVGKSHIYQIRNNKIIHKYIDSSEQCIKGIDHPTKINLITLNDIKSHDQFFICHDDCISIEDEKIICGILSEYVETDEKLSQIKRYYFNKHHSLFTAHLIPIKKIFKKQTFKQRVNALVYSFI
ncbi:hypothetical protein LJB92_02255 [Bacteroidales bacterium OttesenSCG-928-M06]|nr:hypothetical protein [Bacteroidales bacterium OttesenSCG-928-M06]